MKLLGIREWSDGGHTAQYSFIRPAAIAAQTYPGHFLPTPTVSTQYVLASPVETPQEAGEVGPGTAGISFGGAGQRGGGTADTLGAR